jgi:hypothetical protein
MFTLPVLVRTPRMDAPALPWGIPYGDRNREDDQSSAPAASVEEVPVPRGRDEVGRGPDRGTCPPPSGRTPTLWGPLKYIVVHELSRTKIEMKERVWCRPSHEAADAGSEAHLAPVVRLEERTYRLVRWGLGRADQLVRPSMVASGDVERRQQGEARQSGEIANVAARRVSPGGDNPEHRRREHPAGA